ncbi:hypothetical protein ART_1594 [Arthrobacter sp. PAMC 25486]|uniref:hypothetical protein n=1 Tax=Arthrobacter sp. PAMC 25486 TaxID=1494608 RepID=UPI000535FF31|nr:hypothetical protein [Arthrobacter sp. PAMC 25486]AIY01193.1 hypothetical protein ART_1594 [Arthrobacter sp. PAMC 25486]
MSKWLHSRKGLIEGEIVAEDAIWTQIQLKGDQNLLSAKPGARLPFQDGEILTVRTDFLKLIPEVTP